MKIVIRIFNVLIMALSAAAAILLFATPAFSFNSNIAIDVKTFSAFVPETQYTKDYDMVTMLGTDTINLNLKFSVNALGLGTMASGDRDAINNNILKENVDGVAKTLHEPIDLMADFAIRSIVRSTIKDEVSKQIDAAKTEAGSGSSAQDIMDEVGMDDEYFDNFSFALYDSANKDNATVTSVSGVLYEQIDDALAKAEDTGLVDNSGFAEEKKAEITDNLVKVLSDLKLVNDDGSLKKISHISYVYLSGYLKDVMKDKVDPAQLEQQPGESEPDYTDRLTRTLVFTQMPNEFYQVFGGISVGLIVGLILLTVVWGFLFIYTLIRTFTSKPWTMFGPWFFIVGALQVIFGVLLTAITKMVLSNMKIPMEGLPIRSAAMVLRTYALIPSIIFGISIIVAIVYSVFKGNAKAMEE